MTLLFVDGFDHYATADITKKWAAATGSPAINASGGRRGGGALSISGSNAESVSRTLPSAYATLVVGFSQKFDTNLTTARNILELRDGVTVHVTLQQNADGTISVTRNGTVLAVSSIVFAANTEYYLELKANIHDTTGSFTLRANGVIVASGSNVDTRNGGNATVNGVVVGLSGNPGTGTVWLIDDLYILDTSGSSNNDFLGDCRIDTLYPTSDGNYSQFTPSTGSSHFALVDETTPNTSDYNDGATVGDRDSYGMGNLSALTSQTVYGVQVNAAILKDDAGSKSAATFVRSSGTNGDGASAALGTSQVYISQVFETDPSGSIAWTESTVNAMEAGVKVTA